MGRSLKWHWYDKTLKIGQFIEAWVNRSVMIRRLRKFNLEFEDKPQDVFIATYPKSGTTWMQNIVFQIYSEGGDIEALPHIVMFSPTLEEDFIFGPAPISIVQEPRTFKTHMGYDYLYRGKGKYIYVMRNGMDVAVSFYHHHRNFMGWRGSFEQFWEKFIKGDLLHFGSWFEHVRDFTENKAGLNMLIVRYEDLIDDLEGQIVRVAEFLGKDLSGEALKRAVEQSSFAFMKKHQAKFDLINAKQVKMGMQKTEFIRKGKKGSWREMLNAAKVKEYNDTFDEYLKDKDLESYRPKESDLTPATEHDDTQN